MAIVIVAVKTTQGSVATNAESEGGDNHRKSASKSTRQREVAGGAGASKPGTRSLSELRSSWQAILPAQGERLFDEREMIAFLETLNLEEIQILGEDSLTEESVTKDPAARLIRRWGEVDPFKALEALEKGYLKNVHMLYHLYEGWGKRDPKEALLNLEGAKEDLGDRYYYRLIRGNILRSLAGSNSLDAINFVLAHSSENVKELNVKKNSLCIAERDAVFKGLPAETDWSSLADKIVTRVFSPLSLTDNFEHGPGGVFFARWASNDPKSAISWFDETRSNGGEVFHLTFPSPSSLICDWIDFAPEAASSWIDEQVLLEENGSIMSILSKQINRRISNSKWVNLGKHLPDEEDRYQILESANKGGVKRLDDFRERYTGKAELIEDPRGLTPAEIEELLPLFKLTSEHETEILKKIEARKGND